jgi:hypothetical protein
MAIDPNIDPRILEAMEACRPGSDDVADPAMEPLRQRLADSPEVASTYHRLQRLDHAVVGAFGDVPVPEGLQDRILARLGASVGQQSPPEGKREGEAEIASVPGSLGRKAWGRRWLVAACAVGAAAALLLGVVLHYQHSDKLRKPDVLSMAIEYSINRPREGGYPMTGVVQPPRELPFSQGLAAIFSPGEAFFGAMRWRAVQGFLNRDGVAYDLVGRRGVAATVYVTAASVDGLTSDVPLRPMLSTGQSSASAWQEGDLLYVLVVDGGIQDYERFFAVAGGPLT